MSRFQYRYTYTPPRKENGRRREWWLALPVAGFVLVAGLVAALLARGGGSDGDAARCAPGQDCPAAAEPSSQGGGRAFDFAPTPDGDEEPPLITGRAAAVLEEPCRALLFEQNVHQALAPASLTKIATALVAAQRTDLSETVTARVSGFEMSQATDSTVMGLEPGDTVTVRDLLYGMLLPSGNDAAITLAEHVAGRVSGFVALMNDEAARLGLTDTHFSNPHGLDDPGLYTSAYDIAVLGAELLRRPELAEIVRTQVYQPAWEKPPLSNLNRLLTNYPGALGVKIGYTDEAKQTIVGAAERGGRRLIVSVLGSEDVYVDAIALLDWAYENAPSKCAREVGATPESR